MKFLEYPTEKEFVINSELWLKNAVLENPETSIYIPAGKTPIPLYKLLNEGFPTYLRSTKLVQIDDIITCPQGGQFECFLKMHLSSFADQLHTIRDNEPIQADLAILGLGTNGHVAFHEPYLPVNFYHGKVQLSDETCRNLEIPVKSEGLSYGLEAFFNCQKVLLLISGRGKQEALECLLGKNDKNFPAKHLLKHNHLTVMINCESL